jgi:2-dehydropantoate 2-reductase
MTPARVVVFGGGGIGTVIAARATRGAHDVTLVTRNPEVARVANERGLTAHSASDFSRAAVTAVTSIDEVEGVFDLAILALPQNATLAAARQALGVLAEGAPMVVCANGLMEERLVAEGIDEGRIIGGVVTFGASRGAPAEAEQTAPGGLIIGRLERRDPDPALEVAAQVLSGVGPIQVTDNLPGVRWSKLAINCAISALGTIGGGRLGGLMRQRYVRRLALEAMTEVIEVARAEGVRLEPAARGVNPSWLALDEDARMRAGSAGLLARHTMLLAVGTRYRRMRSSMLSAIERGREPAVDYLNGEVVARALRAGVQVPINAALHQEVLAIARGEREASPQTLRALYDRTRGVLRELELVA